MQILLYFYKFQLYEDNWIKSKTINYNILFCGKTHRQPFLHTNIRITNTIIIKFTSVPIALKKKLITQTLIKYLIVFFWVT